MSYTMKGFFGLLVASMVMSTILGYSGIERLRRTQSPPFLAGLRTVFYQVPHPSERTILFLDSGLGRTLAWTLVVLIPLSSAELSFRRGRVFFGQSVLFFSTATYGVIGLSIWFHAIRESMSL